jgi:hypothetical protein
MAQDLHPAARAAAESAADALRALLEARRDRICAELGAHPRPVAACDVHFNRLLEERTAVCRELDRLDALQGGIEAFLASTSCLDDAARRRVLAILERERAARPA